MERKRKIVIILIIIVVLAIGFWTYRTLKLNQSIPLTVQTKYQEFSQTYHGSMGTWLERCTKSGAQSIYLVEGSGGFSGESYYYDLTGKELGHWKWDDAISGDESQPPIDPESYQCTTLKKAR